MPPTVCNLGCQMCRFAAKVHALVGGDHLVHFQVRGKTAQAIANINILLAAQL